MPQGLFGMSSDLLEVVEDDQTFATSGKRVGNLNLGICLAQRHIKRLGDLEVDAIEGSRLREIAEPDATRQLTQPVPCEMHGEASLPATAYADD